MMDLAAEHEDLRATVARFCADEIAPVIADLYCKHAFPYDIVAGMARMGLFGLPFPEEYGGMGGDFTSLCVAIEELARVDSSVAITLEAAVSLGAMPILRFGTHEQRRRWLPDLCRGEALAAFALTEPGGGTDAGALRTTARLDGDHWLINGTKAFITNSGTDITSLVIVTAVTGGTPDRPEISAILVPAGTPGLTVSPAYDKVGWNCSDTHELAFDDVRVHESNLLGERGRGYAQFLEILDEGRIAIAALATGLAQGCVDECVGYARSREAFGAPIATYQAVSFRVADMEVNARASRLLWRDAAERMSAGRPFKSEAAVAKLFSSEAAVDNARWATQVFGGYGFMSESAVGRFYRDAKVLEIGEGTSEVQRLLISRHLGM